MPGETYRVGRTGVWLARILLASAVAAAAQPQDLAPEVLQLAHIKAHMRQELAQMPNYTCVETIERFHKKPGRNASLKPIDTVRLEVAEIGNREMYSWLGGRNFRESSPVAFVGSGMIGSGMFSSDLRSLFVTNQATIAYVGVQDLGGRRAVQYSFRIPVFLSGYTIEVPGAKGIAGMRGWFWADPESLDVLHLEAHAEDVPPDLPMREAVTFVDYGRVRVGSRDVLLPQTGAIRTVEFSGVENRDLVEFTHCRSFGSEATIRFDAPLSPVNASAGRVLPEALETLPAGLPVSIRLSTPRGANSTVGESIEGRVAGNVTRDGTVLIPDGAVVRGRVRRLEHYGQAGDYFIVALEFDEVEAGGSLLRFYADLQSIEEGAGAQWSLSFSPSRQSQELGTRLRVDTFGFEKISVQDLPGVGTFFIQGTDFKLPKGFRMTWKTRALK